MSKRDVPFCVGATLGNWYEVVNRYLVFHKRFMTNVTNQPVSGDYILNINWLNSVFSDRASAPTLIERTQKVIMRLIFFMKNPAKPPKFFGVIPVCGPETFVGLFSIFWIGAVTTLLFSVSFSLSLKGITIIMLPPPFLLTIAAGILISAAIFQLAFIESIKGFCDVTAIASSFIHSPIVPDNIILYKKGYLNGKR